MFLPSQQAIDHAAATVYAAMPPTPQYSWPMINALLDAEAWVKHENHTPTGAYKVRGALIHLERLLRERPSVRGVVSATRGDHGQALAFSARRHGITATIVVPRGNSVEKNAAMVAFGAHLIEHGDDFNDSLDHARLLAERDGLQMVPSFHPDLLLGAATYWTELLRAAPQLDYLLVPVGQGSGICGAIAAREALGLSTSIIGVVSSHAPAYQLSFRARRLLAAPAATRLADGVACRIPHPDSLAMILDYVDDVVAVDDADVARAMRELYRCTHNLAEGAGALALAAALQLAPSGLLRGRRVGLPLTGGNVDAPLFTQVLQGELP
jgi:threonine dehydratase